MLPLEALTVGGLFRRTAGRVPERPALEYGGQTWTYRALDGAVDDCARRLLGLGVRKGDRVGLWCEAEPKAVFALYALARIGAVGTLLNTSLRRPELKDLLERTRARFLLIGDGYKDLDYPALCQNLAAELPGLERVLSIGRRAAQGYGDLWRVPPATEDRLAAAEGEGTPEDTAFILFTSGTTSAPKAVLDSHYSRTNSGIQQAGDLGAAETDRFCVAMPLFHCFCLSVNVMAACAAGACLCLPDSRRTTALLEAVSRGKCTVMSSVPALFHAMLCRPDFEDWDLSSLRTGFIGGSLYPPALFREINDKFGFTLLSSLGQTEATAGITTAALDDPLDVRAETVGHFMDHVEGKIARPGDGAALPAGEVGEICVRGYVVMQGYDGQPEETARTIDREGWLHTGDMGYLDGAGNVHMTGRLKELIIRGGENISPAEVEAAAGDYPGVELCKAVGVPDGHYGEEVCLCVVVRAGSGWTEAGLRTRLSERLAAFKVPRYILPLEEFPRTVTGKVRPADLQAIAREKLGLGT